MANSFLGSPPIWKLDTQSATPVTTDQIRIYRIKWIITAAAVLTDRCTLSDLNGNIIFDDMCTVTTAYDSGDFTFNVKEGKQFNGLVVTTLTRGQVTVYLE